MKNWERASEDDSSSYLSPPLLSVRRLLSMKTTPLGFLFKICLVCCILLQLKLMAYTAVMDDFDYRHGGMLLSDASDMTIPANNHRRRKLVDTEKSDVTPQTNHVDKDKKKVQQQQQQLTQTRSFMATTNATTDKECTLTSSAFHRHSSKARIIVFQRDGGKQLQNLITHYKHVLDYDDIVLIDHLGVDPHTNSILEHYANLGVHVWRCHGPWTRKAEMWSDVTRIYASTSQFVFPLDVDELLGVIVRSTPKTTNNNNNNSNKNNPILQQPVKESIQWNRLEFEKALNRIPHTGKPIKMEKAEPIPLDCNIDVERQSLQDSLRDANNNNNNLDHIATSSVMTGDVCDLQFIQRRHHSYETMITKGFATGRVTCMDKTFAFGQDFNNTDTGNHCGGTFQYPILRKHMFECPKRGIRAMYDISDLILVHFQSVTFRDWLLHGMRGAADKGYNRPGMNCTKGSNSVHYCQKWQAMNKVHFDPYKSRDIFLKDVCPSKLHEVFSIQGLMGPSCSE